MQKATVPFLVMFLLSLPLLLSSQNLSKQKKQVISGDVFTISNRIPYGTYKNFMPVMTPDSFVTTIKMEQIDIPERDYRLGFPKVESLTTWFAIDFTAKFGINKEGKYRFQLRSDDGSTLQINTTMVVQNKGMHRARTKEDSIYLTTGNHDFNLKYFQAAPHLFALHLWIAYEDEPYEIFDINNFPLLTEETLVLESFSLQDTLLFDFSTYVLSPHAYPILDDLVDKLNSIVGDWEMEIIGHTDSDGNAIYNQTLSFKRAEAVKNFFVSKGLASNKISTIGKGEETPIAPNNTPLNKSKNRRVEIFVFRSN